MSGNYLWDKSGEPDPQVQELEQLLAPLRESRFYARRKRFSRVWIAGGIAAGISLVCGGWLWTRTGGPGWTVEAVMGRVESKRLGMGDTLTTTSKMSANLNLASFGKLEVHPRSKMRLLKSSGERQSFALSYGSVRATIWAPPGSFSVVTPAAKAVDLGCVYTVATDVSGDGWVRVEAGWVALERNGRGSFIPGGYACRISSRRGPGVPCSETASEDMRLVASQSDEGSPIVSLPQALEGAQENDAVTLWHLLSRVPQDQRLAVLDRLAQVTRLRGEVNREGVIRGDSDALDRLWTAMGYGDAGWWRQWIAQ